MLPMSLSVAVVATLLVGFALGGFVWAWRHGQFNHLDRQSRIIFDDRDYRLERSWESADQRAEREARFGPLIPPEPGEWGDAV